VVRFDQGFACQNLGRVARKRAFVHPVHAQLDEVVPHFIRGDNRDAWLFHFLRDVRHGVKERGVRDDPEILLAGDFALKTPALPQNLRQVLVVFVVQHEIRVGEAKVKLLGLLLVDGGWGG
jgi:hypothetical protein